MRLRQAQGTMTPEALIDRLVGVTDARALEETIAASRDQMDATFFAALARSAHQSNARGDVLGARRRRLLIDVLLKVRPDGAQAVAAVEETVAAAGEALLEALQRTLQEARTDEELDKLVRDALPMMGGLRKKLGGSALRARVEASVDRVHAAIDAELEAATRLIEAVAQSKDPKQLLAENAAKIGNDFFALLTSSIQRARAEGRTNVVAGLVRLGDLAHAAAAAFTRSGGGGVASH